ncbi:MAG: hypothetical protein JW889_15015 [Verrucomicrobia bacterium]|nr:hypothetical protein [Verrucomicrobiota bacterium]
MKMQSARSGVIGWAIPLLTVLAGAGLLVGGYVYHERAVHMNRNVTYTEEVEIPPPPPPTDPFTGEALGPVLPPVIETVERERLENLPGPEPERRIMLEATRGRIVRLASGEITFTFDEGAEPPPADALCPT